MSWVRHFQRLFLSQKSVGNISWFLHRLTGVALAFYLLPHFFSIHSSRQGAQVFDRELAMYTAPFFKFCEYLLVLTAAYHMFNGLRIIALDCFDLTGHQKWLFWLSMTGCAVVLVSASFLFLPQILATEN